MTDFYNNQIECLIEKNRNMRQERNYHYTNSLLLPTDNQLLAKIAAGLLEPPAPTPTPGSGQDEYRNQRPSSRVPVEEPQPIIIPDDDDPDDHGGFNEDHPTFQAGNAVYGLKYPEIQGRPQGSSGIDRNIVGGNKPEGGKIKAKDGGKIGERHPITGEKRKQTPVSTPGHRSQAERDQTDHDLRDDVISNNGIYIHKSKGNMVKSPYTYDFRNLHRENKEVQQAILSHHNAVRKALRDKREFSSEDWVNNYYDIDGWDGTGLPPKRVSRQPGDWAMEGLAQPDAGSAGGGQLQRAASNLDPDLVVGKKKKLRVGRI